MSDESEEQRRARWAADAMRNLSEDRREELIVAAGDKVFDLRPILKTKRYGRQA